MKSRKKKTIRSFEIAKFIQTKLLERIKEDGSGLYIVSEADFQSSVYLHLRGFLDKYPDWVIYNKQTMGKVTKSKTYPDLVISTFNKVIKPRIQIELKELTKFRSSSIKVDINKLSRAKKNGRTKYGFVIVLCREGEKSRELNSEAEKLVRRKYRNFIFPIIINMSEFVAGNEFKEWERKLITARKLRL